MGERRLTGNDPPTNHHSTVARAADRLGITEAAVRGRIKRGTLGSYRESGKVYVILGGGESPTNRDAPHDVPHDAPRDQSELVEELRDRVRALEEANRENRRIIAAPTSRIPQLEAPRDEPREPHETSVEKPEGSETQDRGEGQQTAPGRGGVG